MTKYTKFKDALYPNSKKIPSPSLFFQKRHAYDNFFDFKTDKSKIDFLKSIIGFIQEAGSGNRYKAWYEDYIQNISTVGAINTTKSYTTCWRLVAGWGENPALETGIQLHHLHGFPYIPGSTVKGLLHHVAELNTINENWRPPDKKDKTEISSEKMNTLEKAVFQVEIIRILFGSVFIRPVFVKNPQSSEPLSEQRFGLETPLEWLEDWVKILENRQELEEITERIKYLVSQDHTGGMLTFYDAIPCPEAFSQNQKDIIQIDILNPHYQKYYQDKSNQKPPSDDQDPNPVHFLAVRPGTPFIFPFKIQSLLISPGRDEAEKERLKILKNLKTEMIEEKVLNWLKTGLSEWGIGAKTASGYGYFHL